MDSLSSELEKMSNDTFFYTCKLLTLEALNELRVTSKLINNRVFQYINHNIKAKKYSLSELIYIRDYFSKEYKDLIYNCGVKLNYTPYNVVFDDQYIYIINSKNIELLNVLKSVHNLEIKNSELNESEFNNKNSPYHDLIKILTEQSIFYFTIIKNIYSIEDLNDFGGINITSNECNLSEALGEFLE